MVDSVLLICQDQQSVERFSKTIINNGLSRFELIHNKGVRVTHQLYQEQQYQLVVIWEHDFQIIEHVLARIRSIDPHVPVVVITRDVQSCGQTLQSFGVFQCLPPEMVSAVAFTQVVNAAIERASVERELRTRDAILSAVSQAAEVFLSQMEWGSRINMVLKDLGQASQSERVYIFQNSMDVKHGLCTTLMAEWYAEGITPKKEFVITQNSSYEETGFGRWEKRLGTGKMIHGPIEDLPEIEKKILSQMGVRSIIVMPVIADGSWWGFMGFDQCRSVRSWSQVEIDALGTAARIFGAAVSRQNAEKRLTHLATHDFLTELPNRMLFEDRFEQAVARAKRVKKKIGIIAIDLDKFKSVNDSHGHPFGDKVLVEIAWRLSDAIRSSDTCARIGGDEFAVLAEGIDNKKDLLRVMEKLQCGLETDIIINNISVRLTASMGASIHPNYGTGLETLMKAADKALYQVKQSYSGFKVFSDEQYSWLEN